MLTRLKVSGFKNLVDVDVYFGPFTCIAGANGVGKSNLFDAIQFLSALAEGTLMDAALSVRSEAGRTGDVQRIFHRVGNQYDDKMSFLVELIVPGEGVDDLGQEAKAAITFLRYELVLAYRMDSSLGPGGSIVIHKEELRHIPLGQAWKQLQFKHSVKGWRRSAVFGRRSGTAFISTDDSGPDAKIKVHSDTGSESAGRPLSRLAANLPRTILSVANAAETRTALLVRKEMAAWRLLQLEPSALRKPDEFSAPGHLGADGAHLPATLYHLAMSAGEEVGSELGQRQIYAQLANRLAELIEDVREVRVDRDESRRLLTLEVTDSSNTPHPARGLSDGTLRFLALAVLELESQGGVICMEEPENGIHPARIPAMIRLLQDIVTDTTTRVGPDNPLRQVIINTHSPVVVSNVPDDSLLVAELKEAIVDGRRFKKVAFSSLDGSWRNQLPDARPPVARGVLLSYLNPLSNQDQREGAQRLPRRRVRDRPDLQMLLPLPKAAHE